MPNDCEVGRRDFGLAQAGLSIDVDHRGSYSPRIMKTKIWPIVVVLAGLVEPGLQGAEPRQPPSGAILILDNERTLEGEIDRQGDQYRVRRANGELWISADRVVRVCQTREEALAFVRSQANLQDPDERIRLAKWCLGHGLRIQAVEEARAAVALRPDYEPGKRLLANLQHAANLKFTPGVSRPVEEIALPSNIPSVTAESMSLFVTRVQPILMNTCASCHAIGKGGNFKLVRTYESTLANRRTTQVNLAAVLEQVNLDHWQLSPLLTKAIALHGDMTQAVFRSREVAAYRTLEEWIKLTIEANPQRLEKPTVASAPPEPAAARTPSAPTEKPAVISDASKGKEIFALRPDPNEGPDAGTSAKSRQPLDPFDPIIFNRQMHPEAGTGEPKR